MEGSPKQGSAGTSIGADKPVCLGIIEHFGSEWLLFSSTQQTSSLNVYFLYLLLIIKHKGSGF